MLENENNFRTGTAWLAFTPSERVKELLADFYKPDIRARVLGNIAIRSDAKATLQMGNNLTYTADDNSVIETYKSSLDKISSHRFRLKRVLAKAVTVKNRPQMNKVVFSFQAETTEDEQAILSRYANFKLNEHDRMLNVYADIPFRYITTDKAVTARARDRLLQEIRSEGAGQNSELYITNPRWADQIDFVRVIDNRSTDVA